jgi:Mg-chelatase subunit ChlI-like protein
MAVKESKERVRVALLNSRFELPAGRITVSLAPADLPKEGGRFDLPIALGILLASGQVRAPTDTCGTCVGSRVLRRAGSDRRAQARARPAAGGGALHGKAEKPEKRRANHACPAPPLRLAAGRGEPVQNYFRKTGITEEYRRANRPFGLDSACRFCAGIQTLNPQVP